MNDHFGTMVLGVYSPDPRLRVQNPRAQELQPRERQPDLSILHSVMQWAVVNEYIERNPFAGIKHPTIQQGKGVVLTLEQFGLLKRSFDDEQDRVMFLAFVLTALRRSELLAPVLA